MRTHCDLWERIQLGVIGKGRRNFAVRKVKGHMKTEDCNGDKQLLEEKRRNDRADELAVKAAKEAKVAKAILDVSRHERKLIRDVQRMMLDIAQARYRAIATMGQDDHPDLEEDLQEEEELRWQQQEEEDMWGGIDIDGNEIDEGVRCQGKEVGE